MLNIALPLAVLGGSLMFLASPALASPQLRHQVVTVQGNSQACLARGRTALTQAGFADPATTANTVSGSSPQLAATIYCPPRASGQVEAIVMVAGSATLAPATIANTLNQVTVALGQTGGPSPTPAPSGTPLGDAAFDRFMAALRSSWPNYLEFLAQPVANTYFTAAQASQIVGMMRFPNEEVDAAVMLYPRVVDRENWFMVEQAMSFESSRRELRQRLTP